MIPFPSIGELLMIGAGFSAVELVNSWTSGSAASPALERDFAHEAHIVFFFLPLILMLAVA